MHPDPTQLGMPVRVVTGSPGLHGITTSSHVEVVRYVMNHSLFTGQQGTGDPYICMGGSDEVPLTVMIMCMWPIAVSTNYQTTP